MTPEADPGGPKTYVFNAADQDSIAAVDPELDACSESGPDPGGQK
jgi:hypothetical protein